MKLRTQTVLLPIVAVCLVSAACWLGTARNVFGNDKTKSKARREASYHATGKTKYSDAYTFAPQDFNRALTSDSDGVTHVDFGGVTHLDYDAEYWKKTENLQNVESATRKAQQLFDMGNIGAAKTEALKVFKKSQNANGVSFSSDSQMLLGEIALLQGNNLEALNWFTNVRQFSSQSGLDWQIALCHARMGNLTEAKRFYSEDAFLKMATGLTRDDLPGTRTQKQLEASILAALAAEVNSSCQYERALRYLDAAASIAPRNAWILHSRGMTFMWLRQSAEAYAAFKQVVDLGESKYLDDATQQVHGFEVYWRIHPETKPLGVKL